MYVLENIISSDFIGTQMNDVEACLMKQAQIEWFTRSTFLVN